MWDKSPSLFADVVERAAVKRVKNIATDMLTAVVDHSAVDTGRFSANNRVSGGTRAGLFNPNDFSGRAGAMARGIADIKGLPNDKLQDIWIYNDTPYGIYLEDVARYKGSAQSPDGTYLVSFLAVSMFYR